MGSTQSRMDFEDMDFLHLPLCARQGLQVKFFYLYQSSWESLLLTLRSVQEEQAKQSIIYAVSTLPNGSKIYYGWRVTCYCQSNHLKYKESITLKKSELHVVRHDWL